MDINEAIARDNNEAIARDNNEVTLMDNTEATAYLSHLIDQPLRIHTSDGRVFGGQMKCTDKHRNIILALTYEYRAPSADAIRKAVQESGNPSAPVNWNSRYVGLVVVPGAHVKKIEFVDSTLSGQPGRVVL
ncbi:hypothetical protein PMIN04_003886 [Paraphaeosphaeria minitans]